MEWLTALKETIRYIENNLNNDISIGELSQNVCMSQFYLQKGFRIMTGFSIGEYIRNRRMYESALRLTETEDKIIDIALDFGYETPESFTKAFSRFHGCTPSQARNGEASIRHFLPIQIQIEITGGNKMDYVISPMWGFKVIGFEREFSYDTAYREIPKFLDEICEKYCNNTIYAGLAPSCPEEQAIIDNCIGEYGVCIDDIGNGKFRYMIAGKYTGGQIPDSMTVFEFPQGEWAKFKCIGAMPDSLQKLNTEIFKNWLPGNPEFEMAGYYNIEWYSCDGEKTDSDYESGIWVPIRRYRDEAEKRWGNTDEFARYKIKASQRTDSQNEKVNDGLMKIFAKFGNIKDCAPECEKAQSLVAELQGYISENFYPCPNEFLKNLGAMYVGDKRFKDNIDRHGGTGTAEFVNNAISCYCKKR